MDRRCTREGRERSPRHPRGARPPRNASPRRIRGVEPPERACVPARALPRERICKQHPYKKIRSSPTSGASRTRPRRNAGARRRIGAFRRWTYLRQAPRECSCGYLRNRRKGRSVRERSRAFRGMNAKRKYACRTAKLRADSRKMRLRDRLREVRARKNSPKKKITQMHSLCSHQITQYHLHEKVRFRFANGFTAPSIFTSHRTIQCRDAREVSGSRHVDRNVCRE